MQNQTSPLILTFGVSDPVGATGIQGDLTTFAALGCHGLSVTTAALIGDTARVEAIQQIDPDWVCDQARVLLEDMAVAAIKVGAPGGVEHVSAIAEIISDYPQLPLILDPFISALPEQGMGEPDMLMALRQLLVPQATLLMLSHAELGRLAETWRDASSADLLQADVEHLLEQGCRHVLVTGRPQAGDGTRADTLFDASGVIGHHVWQPLAGAFLGAGSTLSAAIAALMAPAGAEAARAVPAAHRYTAGALAHAQRFGMGRLVPHRFFQRLAAPGDALAGAPDSPTP